MPFTASNSDTLVNDIVAQPAETPNSVYAVLNDRGNIELCLNGANPNVAGDGISENTVTPIDQVFTITYTGDQYAEVWITDDSDDVRFYRGDDPERSIERADDSVHLGPDQTMTVGLLIDTRGDDDVESADTFTIHAEVAEPDPDDEDDDDDEDDEETETATPTATATDTPTSATPTETATQTAAETPAQTDARPAAAPSGAIPPNASDGGASNSGDAAASGDQALETASFDIPPLFVAFAAVLAVLSLGIIRRKGLV